MHSIDISKILTNWKTTVYGNNCFWVVLVNKFYRMHPCVSTNISSKHKMVHLPMKSFAVVKNLLLQADYTGDANGILTYNHLAHKWTLVVDLIPVQITYFRFRTCLKQGNPCHSSWVKFHSIQSMWHNKIHQSTDYTETSSCLTGIERYMKKRKYYQVFCDEIRVSNKVAA